MQIEMIDGDGFKTVCLEGDVDLSCSPEARQHVLAVLESGKNLLVNLEKVTYIDSSGIAVLVEAYQTAKKQSARFGLVAVSEAAMSVISLARLDKVFPIYENTEMYLAQTA